MYIYFCLFLFIFFSLIPLSKTKQSCLDKNKFWLVFIILFFIAGFRAKGVDTDMGAYITSIKEKWGIAEFSFFIISNICYDIIGSVRLVFVIYAVISLFLVFISYRKLSNTPHISIILYFCFYYVVHNLNQIRAGLATGFALLSIYYWLKIPSQKKVSLLFILLAIISHYSFIIFIPILLLIRNSSKNIIIYISLIPISYLLHYFSLTPVYLLSYLNIDYLVNKLILYQEFGKDVVQEVNVFSLLILLKLLFIVILISFRRILSKTTIYFYFYLKLYIVGLFSLIVLSDMPGMAFRTAELFWIIEPLILPTIFVKLKPLKISYCILFILCCYWVWLNYYKSGFLNPYYFSISL